MDYVVQLVGILAWPLVAIIAMAMFGKELKSIVKRLSSLETSAGKWMFDRELKELESNLSSSYDETGLTNTLESRSWLLEMREIAKINPRAAIVESWTAIEMACIDLGMVKGTTMNRFSPNALEDFLREIPNFDNDLLDRINELRKLRNRVIHGIDTDFMFLDADKYISLSDRVLNLLNNSKSGIKSDDNI